jgi:uncharacterized membrane protein YgaE (UPF0421/DUF939 family)
LGRTLRSRAKVTARLRELAPMTRWRDRTWADLLGINATVLVQALKIALSASVSWALAQWLFGSPAPIYAPITASFVALITIRASIRDAYQRVLGVLVGIFVAIGLGELMGLHAWSIGAIVAVGFLVGKLLRLEPGAAAQIPITGLLLIGLGQGAGYAQTRILDTLVGAVVAVVVNIVVVPPNRVHQAREAVDQLAQLSVDVLSEMGDGIAERWTRGQADRWLRRARENRQLVNRAENEADTAEDSLRLHPGRRNWTEALTGVHRALRTLRVIGVQVSVLARTMRDTADRIPDVDGRQVPLPRAGELLRTTAGAVDAFSHALLADPPDGTAGTFVAAGQELALARAQIADIRADLQGLLDANLARGIYLGTLVVETERILDELTAAMRPTEPEDDGDNRSS